MKGPTRTPEATKQANRSVSLKKQQFDKRSTTVRGRKRDHSCVQLKNGLNTRVVPFVFASRLNTR